MASDQAVKPLRISKTTMNDSPEKPQSRALADLGAGNQRRNSPSYNQATRKMIVSREHSPFVSDENSSFLSPNSASEKKGPRNFWTHFDRENNLSSSRVDSESSLLSRSPSPGLSPHRRPSVEKLLNAGRVRGSNIFALESKDKYDPAAIPVIERPSANRPLSQQLANNSFHRLDSLRKEQNPVRMGTEDFSPQLASSTRDEFEGAPQWHPPSLEASEIPLPASPSKSDKPLSRDSPSPTKSSMARMSMFDRHAAQMEAENNAWSDEEGGSGAMTPRARSLHRQNKNVTFGSEPPSMYEYEDQTPEPSVEASSREGSWDTEDMEEEDYSFERGSSADYDRDDSFDVDLENTDKTPVVLPEQWSRVTPEDARTDLVDDGDDVFEGSPEPHQRPALGRSESVTSNSSNRPLPAIPGSDGRGSEQFALAAVAERASRLSLGLPKPAKRPSCSQEEVARLKKQSSMMLRDHLERETEQEASDLSLGLEQDVPEEFIVKNLDTGEQLDVSIQEEEGSEDNSVLHTLDTFTAPRISRESILSKVRNTKYDFDDPSDDEGDVSEVKYDGRPSYAELARLDPDVAIPSRENSTDMPYPHTVTAEVEELSEFNEVEIKSEPADDESVNMSAIPEAPHPFAGGEEFETSVLIHRRSYSEDDEGENSTVESEQEQSVLEPSGLSPTPEEGKETLDQAMGLLSVRDFAETITDPASHQAHPHHIHQAESFVGLPTYSYTPEYDFGIREYVTPSPPPNESRQVQDPVENILPTPHQSMIENEEISEEPEKESIDVEEQREPDSPNSVIHRPSWPAQEQMLEPVSPVDLGPSPSHSRESVSPVDESISVLPEQPEIPERRSTIKTSGRLKTRPSASRAELEEIRAQLEAEDAELEPVPRLSDQYQPEASTNEEATSTLSEESKNDSILSKTSKQGQLTLDIPRLASGHYADDGFGNLDAEFDRVMENQKKGYLMRQNTKVVVATNRNFSTDTTRSAEANQTPISPTSGEPRPSSRRASGRNASRKPSAEQWMKTEPWNGKARRKSQRNASAQGTFVPSAAPPLPGKESVLKSVDEDYATHATGSLDGEVADGVERGRLFVKVVKVKELDLPLPRNDRLYFQLTLDNGLHCVTTSDLELGRSATIGQEFELVVLNDLDFQLTLTTKLPPPRKRVEEEIPRPQRSPQKTKQGPLSKLLSTPKRRAERERQEREAFEAEERRYQEELRRKRASIQPTVWDKLHELVNASDGSFARSYVNLAAHEQDCFGRQVTVDVPCYNEWALEKDQAVVSSVRSKGRGRGGEIRKPPYIIGKLEVQLLYVPKPKGLDDDVMPKSMNGAIREMNKASEIVDVTHEGHLSQQGGDCTHWRRRFFRLQGSRLTAYHEHTNQKRAVINLSKAARLVDDRSALVADPVNASPTKGRRRKSAFAEEDEGYQYVEEGFRIRFANGETIDFYADSRAQKEGWMSALGQMIGKPDAGTKKPSWTDVVLAREKAQGKLLPPTPTQQTEATEVQPPSSPHNKPVSAFRANAQSNPIKGPPPYRAPDPPRADVIVERPRSQIRSGTPPLEPRRGHRSRDAVKSMIF